MGEGVDLKRPVRGEKVFSVQINTAGLTQYNFQGVLKLKYQMYLFDYQMISIGGDGDTSCFCATLIPTSTNFIYTFSQKEYSFLQSLLKQY